MLIGGKKGHLGLMDWQSGRTFCEVQVIQPCSYSYLVCAASELLRQLGTQLAVAAQTAVLSLTA